MQENRPLTTRVRVIDRWSLRGQRNATLELRGRTLMLTSVKSHCSETHLVDIAGATYERMKNRASVVVFAWIGMAALLYLLYKLCYMLFPFHTLPAPLLTGTVGVLAARYLKNWSHVYRTPAAHIRLNIPGTVYDLRIRHTPGEDLILDEILAEMRPFEQSFHQFSPGRHAYLGANCLMVFPAHYLAVHSPLSAGAFFLSAAKLCAADFMIAHDFEPLRVKLYFVQALLWAGLGFGWMTTTIFRYRAERKPPELRAAIRSVLGYVEAGEFERCGNRVAGSGARISGRCDGPLLVRTDRRGHGPVCRGRSIPEAPAFLSRGERSATGSDSRTGPDGLTGSPPLPHPLTQLTVLSRPSGRIQTHECPRDSTRNLHMARSRIAEAFLPPPPSPIPASPSSHGYSGRPSSPPPTAGRGARQSG